MLPQSEHDRQKAALMEATVKAVAEDGMENLSTREISRRCGVKEVYIYRYFENKDDMVAKTFAESDERFLKLVLNNLPVMKNEAIEYEARCRYLFTKCWEYMMANSERVMFYIQYDTVLNHTGLYEYLHGKMLMHLRFAFESLNTLKRPGEYMRYYRQLRGLTTRQLAEELNIVPATVIAYEQGRFPIPYDIAVLSAKVLQISESLLFDDYCVFISAPYTELLYTVRKRYGLNQVNFAEKACISPSIYAKWESGSRRPSRKMYQQLKVIYPEI